EAPSPNVARVTAREFSVKKPKFEIVNELLADLNLSSFDYVLICDDDVVLPHKFLDRFVSLQSAFGFAIAQPALTTDSLLNHQIDEFVNPPIVEQQRGTVARETRFVENGPVVSFEGPVFAQVIPFDLTSPMGWGYELVWASRLGK